MHHTVIASRMLKNAHELSKQARGTALDVNPELQSRRFPVSQAEILTIDNNAASYYFIAGFTRSRQMLGRRKSDLLIQFRWQKDPRKFVFDVQKIGYYVCGV